MSHTKRGRSGFTLLEVILALAILAGSMAVLAEFVRMGTFNAQDARDLSKAQLLCDSVLAEIVSGVTQADPVANVPLAFDPQWVYSIDNVQIADTSTGGQGLVALKVTVSRDPSYSRRPLSFSLVRWIPDPNATQTSSDASTQQSSSSTSKSSASGTGSTATGSGGGT